jgi:hypothetical protein
MLSEYLILLAAAVVAKLFFTNKTIQQKALQGKTIVFIRHGEKPADDLGQLKCQGLNRSLAIPDVLIGRYGRASKIYAPNPAIKNEFEGKGYYYIRPLATIEPTAIRLGLPVDVKYGYKEVEAVANELFHSKHNLIFVAWEHVQLVKLVRKLLIKYGANPDRVHHWKGTDFDSIYVVNIHGGKVRFLHDHQGLDGQSTVCKS